MTRQADPQSKTLRLSIIPKTGQDEKIRAFKEICIRNNLRISDVLYEKVEHFLKEHHWPPGNSQTILEVFTDIPVVVEKPKRRLCPKTDKWTRIYYCDSMCKFGKHGDKSCT